MTNKSIVEIGKQILIKVIIKYNLIINTIPNQINAPQTQHGNYSDNPTHLHTMTRCDIFITKFTI